MGACCNTADQVSNSDCVVPGNNTGGVPGVTSGKKFD